MDFVKPNAVFLLKDRNPEEKNENVQYAHFDRAFIVTNESGYNNLLKHAQMFFNDDVVEFFDDFIATHDIDYIISVQWGIFEAFVRSAYSHAKQGIHNIPHIVYDLLSNINYRKYFPFVNFKENELENLEQYMDNNTYDLLSYEDVCNLDTEISSKHITMHIQMNCSTHAYNHFFNNMDYKSCVSSNYNAERYIVPVEVIQDEMFKEFKTACRANYKLYKHFENIDYCFAKTIIEHCAERELIVEITIENFIVFIEKYLNNEITMDTMEIKCLTYLMCTLAKDIFGIFFNDKLNEMLSLLGKDSNKIADALSIMNNL